MSIACVCVCVCVCVSCGLEQAHDVAKFIISLMSEEKKRKEKLTSLIGQ